LVAQILAKTSGILPLELRGMTDGKKDAERIAVTTVVSPSTRTVTSSSRSNPS
jgi:hypothetical protein